MKKQNLSLYIRPFFYYWKQQVELLTFTFQSGAQILLFPDIKENVLAKPSQTSFKNQHVHDVNTYSFLMKHPF